MNKQSYINKQYLRTYIQNNDEWFFVSTINRLDSTPYQVEFSETFVWKWDEKEQKRGEMIYEASGRPGSPIQHMRIIDNLLSHGKCEIEEEDNA